jgi:hypothetical protein
MSFFFSGKQDCRAKWSVKRPSNIEHSLALVGKSIWQSLSPVPATELTAVSIFPMNAALADKKLICYARFEDKVSCHSVGLILA